jgi:hypothetical protein
MTLRQVAQTLAIGAVFTASGVYIDGKFRPIPQPAPSGSPFLTYTELGKQLCRADEVASDGGAPTLKYSGAEPQICEVAIRFMTHGFNITQAATPDAGTPPPARKGPLQNMEVLPNGQKVYH